MWRQFIAAEFRQSIQTKQEVLAQQVAVLAEIAEMCVEALQQGRKLLFCGNGGSAADSQHLAGELVSRYRTNRRALPAIALTTDTSILTSAGNDFGYEHTFARQVEALGVPGDVLIAISTSGNSPNVLLAAETARARGLKAVGFTGKTGGKLKALVDLCFCVPSTNTPRIQETHITAGHAICDIIEQQLGRSDA